MTKLIKLAIVLVILALVGIGIVWMKQRLFHELGDKFRKSYDAYSHNYVGNSDCEVLDVACSRGRLEIMQIVADQARAYKATPEAATSFNGKLADAFIELNNVEQAFYRKLANSGGRGLRDAKELEPLLAATGKLRALFETERDELIKRSIQ